MLRRFLAILILVVSLSWNLGVIDASAGDEDPRYRVCVKECKETGCVGETCFPYCKFSSNDATIDGTWFILEPLYCQSDCCYHCMIDREKEREALLGSAPLKYHGKWPFKRVYGIQEPASVIFSLLNLAMNFHGWLSFFILVNYKLPLKGDKKAYYEFASLWHIYGLLTMNSWLWSAVSHCRDVELMEKLDYSSTVVLLGYSLIVAILRSCNLRDDAARVMVTAPVLAFVTTHIMFQNFYKLNYGWNMIVCVFMAVLQLLIWAIFGRVTRHPSRWKLWLVVVAGGLSMLLKICDFPPYEGYVDAHALWHATTVPLTYIWWSFVRDDAAFRTMNLLKKAK
uniref:Post-GPI attachment to proteins factor 3 n=2 Tax=Cannabis sativa TaxID=3483 RepID=A0A803QU54_CANSA